ncbi:MAG: hypothetical protein LBJ81_02425 [Puniceicoccales bacterium]|nr:hypothetical protein [Puniceicoccales bacterium]
MKRKNNIWFWLIASAIMMFAVCILAWQLIELHLERNLKKSEEKPVQAAVAPPNDKEEKIEAAEEVTAPTAPVIPVPVGRRPRAVPSKKMRTPKVIHEYERTLYDVPRDGQGGFWAILRGLRPNAEVIRFDEVMELKYRSAQCAEQTELGPSPNEIGRLFGEREMLDTAALPYVAHALARDMIVTSSDESFGCDLFTAEGETFHYDSIDEIHKEAANEKTIWLHFDKAHWTVAIGNGEAASDGVSGEAARQRETYFLMNS